MSKYIIEIEDEPFVRLSALFGEEGLYRAKGFNSLVFDQVGLDKLTPLDKALDEAYQKGVHDGSLDVKERVEGAYQKGYDEAKLIYQNPNAESDYQRGLDDAWEAAKKIVISVDKGGLSGNDLLEIFGCESTNYAFRKYSASEVIEKLKSYEEQQKADEIKVGDEVTPKSNDSNWKGVVVGIEGEEAQVMTDDGYSCGYRIDIMERTGRHFPQVEELLKAMKDEQRNCSTCKYDRSGATQCIGCNVSEGYNEWEPKEGAE